MDLGLETTSQICIVPFFFLVHCTIFRKIGILPQCQAFLGFRFNQLANRRRFMVQVFFWNILLFECGHKKHWANSLTKPFYVGRFGYVFQFKVPYMGTSNPDAFNIEFPPKQSVSELQGKHCGIQLSWSLTCISFSLFVIFPCLHPFTCQAVWNWRNSLFCQPCICINVNQGFQLAPSNTTCYNSGRRRGWAIATLKLELGNGRRRVWAIATLKLELGNGRRRVWAIATLKTGAGKWQAQSLSNSYLKNWSWEMAGAEFEQ